MCNHIPINEILLDFLPVSIFCNFLNFCSQVSQKNDWSGFWDKDICIPWSWKWNWLSLEPLQCVWNFIFLLKFKVSIDTTSVHISRVLQSEPCLDITDTIVPACVICLQWNAYNTPRWEYPNVGLWHACLSAICSSHSLQVCILEKCWLTLCSQVVKTASDIYNCLHEMKTLVLVETGFSWY